MIEIGKVYQVRVGSHHISCLVQKALGEDRFTVKTMGSGKTFPTYAGAIRGEGVSQEEYAVKTAPKKPEAPATAPPEKKTRTVHVKSPGQKKVKAAKKPKDRKPSGLDAAVVVLATMPVKSRSTRS